MYREYRCDLVFLSSWKFYQHSFDVRICFRKECRETELSREPADKISISQDQYKHR